MQTLYGTIAALYRYPIKSLLGEPMEASMVTERGLDGDRTYGLIDDETGKVASAKVPRLWRDLLQYRAARTSDGIAVTMPDGAVLLEDDVAEALSKRLGRRLSLSPARAAGASLERSDPEQVLEMGVHAQVASDSLEIGQAAPKGGFFDFAPVQVLSKNSLQEIASAVPDQKITKERYRPNILLDLPDAPPFIENEWRGAMITIGDVKLQIVAPTPRCAVPMLEHGVLAASPGAVSAVARLNRTEMPELAPGLFPCLGAFAVVASPGELHVSQTVAVEI
ncbi:MOSC domain-containing protein [Ruegeria sp. EL01]|jgi:hypothetical protein|uniref:MOSC domain-containing protein n=1 Tax=Ruegeria sp. EL01 TaxID=2107578 RepID=UPI000EA7F323|nr:MOSC N-terminal beta barrel domain-containing protein [Ruegeria sp. EL01]